MMQLIEEFRADVAHHYLEGCNWDLKINPDMIYSGKQYTPEEELVLTIYVKEEMPYLELYEEGGETKFRRVSEVPEEDQLIYYKTSYLSLRNEHYSFYSKIQNVLEGY